MQPNSIAGASVPKLAPEVPQAHANAAASSDLSTGSSRKVRFPGEDGGRSLNEMAQRDLDATLQLLAERAQYITGATGAAIALRDGADIVCRASAGSVAPEIGAHLQVESGLSGESIRTKQVLRCDNAQTDTRVNRESCEALGIASVVVMPLLHDQEVNGVFELLSDRPYAFEERDLGALERLGDMVQTALEHAAAAREAADSAIPDASAVAVESPIEDLFDATIPSETVDTASDVDRTHAEIELDTAEFAVPELVHHARSNPATDAKKAESVEEITTESAPAAQTPAVEAEMPIPLMPDLPKESSTIAGISQVRKCSVCGFPVSAGRTLCLDCEKKQKPTVSAAAASAQASSGHEAVSVSLFTMGAEGELPESWFARNRVLMVVAGVVVILVIGLFLLR